MDLWRAAYTAIFPPDKATAKSDVPDDPAAIAQYAETAVDAMRKQMDEVRVCCRLSILP